MTVYPLLKPLQTKSKSGRTLWQVQETIRIKLAPRWYVQVDEGYVSNLGTIPRWARWLISPDDFPGPFVIHDWMCNEDFIDDGVQIDNGYPRWLADATLYHLLTIYKPSIPAWKAWVVWFAVRFHARWSGLK